MKRQFRQSLLQSIDSFWKIKYLIDFISGIDSIDTVSLPNLTYTGSLLKGYLLPSTDFKKSYFDLFFVSEKPIYKFTDKNIEYIILF